MTSPATLFLPSSPWESADASRRAFERRALPLAAASLVALLVGLFGTGAYVHCGRWEYLAISLVLTAPSVAAPFIAPPAIDAGRPYRDRFGVKATLWLAIFGFIGNWFWSHYFYIPTSNHHCHSRHTHPSLLQALFTSPRNNDGGVSSCSVFPRASHRRCSLQPGRETYSLPHFTYTAPGHSRRMALAQLSRKTHSRATL